MNFNDVPKKYRPIPFWSWNEKLTPEEDARQIQLMHDAGIGGFFMHARGGLQTEYMGEEWFENVKASMAKAKELGMYAWAYDENGWPSGFGGGIVNGKGEKYQQKYLRMSEERVDEAHAIAQVGKYYFYYEINPFYVDVLDPMVIRDFIEEIYEKYYEELGSNFTGFFTDEPQISRNGIPWSNVMLESYQEVYGEDLTEHLPELFLEQGDYKKTRVRFWKLTTELFSKNFMKQIYDWCHEHDLKFTGHMVLEETFESQLTTNGAVMPHYEYLDIPGMDCLGRRIIYDLTSWQLGSVAAQLGKKQVLSETFALCGHNVSFDELRVIYTHQMVHGINLLCQHLEGYSLRGIRKRDYPPAMYYQQPWWSEYEKFCTAMSRAGMILSQGQVEVTKLLIHPQTTAWSMFNNQPSPEMDAFYDRFKKLVNQLDAWHIPFHLGDEILMERHGRVENGKLIIGEMAYSEVMIPEHQMFFENTEKLLAEFKAQGGKIIQMADLQPCHEVVDNPNIIYTKRILEDGAAYFLLNHTAEPQDAHLAVGTCVLDLATGEKKALNREYRFAPYESLMILEDKEAKVEEQKKTIQKNLNLDGDWKVDSMSPNLLTLDRCDYYFDGELQEKDGYVLNIQNRALDLEKPVHIRQEYHFDVKEVPQQIALLCETPEIYKIQLNGQEISNAADGWYIDTAFKKLDLAGKVQTGRNTLTLDTDFQQDEEVYQALIRSRIFESEKNKLHFGMEIEPCYLMGSFAVKAQGDVTTLERNAFRIPYGFTIEAMSETMTLKEMEKQGLLFFAGNITLSKEIEIEDPEQQIALLRKGVNAVKVQINGQEAGTILYRSEKIDAAPYLKKGKNEIRLTLINNLRNMMGPHHLKEGESYTVGPGSFFKENSIFAPHAEKQWHEDYCFVEMSLEEDEA